MKQKLSDIDRRVMAVERARKAAGISLRAVARAIECEHSTLLRAASGETERVKPWLVDSWERKLAAIIVQKRRQLDSI